MNIRPKKKNKKRNVEKAPVKRRRFRHSQTKRTQLESASNSPKLASLTSHRQIAITERGRLAGQEKLEAFRSQSSQMATRHRAIISWGSGEDGQLGIGNNEEKEWVCAVKSLAAHNVVSVVAGSRNSLAICDDGKVSPLLLTSTSLSFFVD